MILDNPSNPPSGSQTTIEHNPLWGVDKLKNISQTKVSPEIYIQTPNTLVLIGNLIT